MEAMARSMLVTSSKPTFLPASSASFHVRISCKGGEGGRGRSWALAAMREGGRGRGQSLAMRGPVNLWC